MSLRVFLKIKLKYVKLSKTLIRYRLSIKKQSCSYLLQLNVFKNLKSIFIKKFIFALRYIQKTQHSFLA